MEVMYMQYVMDFLEKLYTNGNVRFSFKKKENYSCVYDVAILSENHLQVDYMWENNRFQSKGENNTDNLFRLIAELACLQLADDMLDKIDISITSLHNHDNMNRNKSIAVVNKIYTIMNGMLKIDLSDKERVLLSLVEAGPYKKMIDFLVDNAKKHMTDASNLDLKTIEILVRSELRNFKKFLEEGMRLYFNLKESTKDDYSTCLENWNHFIGKEDSSLKMDETEKKVIRPEDQRTKIDSLDKKDISYVFLDEDKYTNHPAVGRDKEIEQLCVSLFTLTKSPILVGEAGVGKTAIVEELGYLIQKGEVPNNLKDKKIMKISISSLVSGCMYVGMFEQKLETLLAFLKENTNVILFLDEMHTAIGAGASSKSDLDLANILKPYLDRGQIKIIGATTREEYDQLISRDTAFKRRFERINVLEPDRFVLRQIIDSYILKLSLLSNVVYPFLGDAHEQIVSILLDATDHKNRVYSDRRNNPDLVLSILEKAFAYAQYHGESSLSVNDLSRALEMCDVLYEDNRMRFARKMEAINSTPNVSRSKVIHFPKKY